jgi:hypothetical protein
MALVGHVRLVADGSPLGVGQQAEQTEREQGRAEPRRSPDADKDVFRVLQQVEAAFSRPRGLCRQAPSWWRVCPAFVRIVPSGLSVQFPVRAKGTGSSVGASRDQPGLGSRPLPARPRNRPATIPCTSFSRTICVMAFPPSIAVFKTSATRAPTVPKRSFAWQETTLTAPLWRAEDSSACASFD